MNDIQEKYAAAAKEYQRAQAVRADGGLRYKRSLDPKSYPDVPPSPSTHVVSKHTEGARALEVLTEHAGKTREALNKRDMEVALLYGKCLDLQRAASAVASLIDVPFAQTVFPPAHPAFRRQYAAPRSITVIEDTTSLLLECAQVLCGIQRSQERAKAHAQLLTEALVDGAIPDEVLDSAADDAAVLDPAELLNALTLEQAENV